MLYACHQSVLNRKKHVIQCNIHLCFQSVLNRKAIYTISTQCLYTYVYHALILEGGPPGNQIASYMLAYEALDKGL